MEAEAEAAKKEAGEKEEEGESEADILCKLTVPFFAK